VGALVSLLFKRGLGSAEELISQRSGRNRGYGPISRDKAMRNSAVWACLRLRADLISSMPVDVFRRVDGIQVEVTKPAVFLQPGGADGVRWMEWAYSSQVDLDSLGNTVGVILEKDANGLPVVIELADMDTVSFIGRGGKIEKVRIGGTEYDPSKIWHEKQYTRAGCPIGLSPIAYAASVLNAHLSAQEFALDWFSNASVPGGHLKNTGKTLNKAEAAAAKDNFKATVQAGDIWVSGMDWEYTMLAAKASESQFLEAMGATIPEVCRFLGTPADMIDAESGGKSITYANITQRNLQLLVMNLGPAIARREDAWSWGLLPRPRYAKLNAGAVLRMDLKSRLDAHKVAIDARILAPSEARELEDRPPFTPEQLAEFAIFSKAPTPNATPTPQEAP
jgi:HK97 family phage portal protein